jgi:thymidylate synthase
MEINALNVNQAVNEGFHWLASAGIEEASRNGPVIVSPEPVLTTYAHPQDRVLFSPLRDANPFFHLMEALWMLSGSNTIAFPTYFNSKFVNYSDDGKTQWAAYGHRWRNWFGYDQLASVVRELQQKPESRRAVLAMWDATDQSVEIDGYNPRLVGANDLLRASRGGVDVPCNTHAYVDLRGGVLNLTILCRSNDMLWGGYGANAVHFSVLQEYLAAWLKVPVGKMYQFSNNYHVYPNSLGTAGEPRQKLKELAVDADIYDAYKNTPYTRTMKLVNTDIPTWDADLAQFMREPGGLHLNYGDVFFRAVAAPMYRAYQERKEKRGTGLEWARLIGAEDWRKACVDWIVRRENKKEATK